MFHEVVGCAMQRAVEVEKVDVMTVTVGTQRRAVLEAIAFGSFLRDIETHIDAEYHLLTPGSSRCLPGMNCTGVVLLQPLTVLKKLWWDRRCLNDS
jgi:hypothetical protein